MNDLHFAGRYQCLPIRCSGILISLHNEHTIYVYAYDIGVFIINGFRGALTAWLFSYTDIGCPVFKVTTF
jgi:hypothetical protein